MYQRHDAGKFVLVKRLTLVILVLAAVDIRVSIAQAVDPLRRSDAAITDYSDGEGRPRSVVSDAFGQLVSGVDAAGLQTVVNRNSRGNALTTTLPSGAVTDQSFDNRGNVTSRTDQTLGGTVSFGYEPSFGQVNVVTDPFGSQTLVAYDNGGNATQILTPEGRPLNVTYRADGLLATLTDSLGTVATVSYNADLQPTDLAVGSGVNARSAQRSYTAEGYLDTDTDGEGRVIDLDYDLLGRVTQATLPDTRVIAYAYDAAGDLTSLTPPGRSAYGYSYNSVGLLSAETYPAVTGGGTNQVDYAYNQARQLTRITRADGAQVTYTYDDAGRNTVLSQPNGDYVVSYGVTTGMVDSLVSPNGITQSFLYDNNLLTQISWSGAISGSVGYGYDAAGRLATISVSGQDFAYSYSPDGDVVQVGQQNLSYDASSGLVSGTTLDSISEVFAYNEFAEVIGHAVSFGATTLYDVTYTRDRLGRITQKSETIEGVITTVDYSYDLAGRLTLVSENSTLIASYTYDSNDNRTDNGGTYDAQDRVTAQAGVAYQYNANGERTAKTDAANITQYQYDASGTLIGATLPNADQLSYLLDGQGRRVLKQLNGVTTEGWLYGDELSPVARLDSISAVTQRYVYADRTNVPAYIDAGPTRYKVIADHLGSVRLVVDASSGAVIQRMDYDAWGNVTSDTNPNFQPFAFAGGLHDNDTTLTHFGFREYDAASAHWTTKDPIGFVGSINNHYAYGGADPVNTIDSDGLESSSSNDRDRKRDHVAKVLGIDGKHVWITTADGKRVGTPLRSGDKVCLGDIIETGSDTSLMIEFVIGGRAGINKDTEIKVTGLRDIDTTATGLGYLDNKLKTMWAKVDKQKQRLQISTAGGVIGASDDQ